MCWQAVVRNAATTAIDTAKDAMPAAGVVGVATIGGVSIGVPPLLVGLGQAAIVVYFTLRGVDRRMKERDVEVKELAGAIATLAGRFEMSCANPRHNPNRRSTDHPPCPPDPSWVE